MNTAISTVYNYKVIRQFAEARATGEAVIGCRRCTDTAPFRAALPKKSQCDALSQTVRIILAWPEKPHASIFFRTRRTAQNYKAKLSIRHISVM